MLAEDLVRMFLSVLMNLLCVIVFETKIKDKRAKLMFFPGGKQHTFCFLRDVKSYHIHGKMTLNAYEKKTKKKTRVVRGGGGEVKREQNN